MAFDTIAFDAVWNMDLLPISACCFEFEFEFEFDFEFEFEFDLDVDIFSVELELSFGVDGGCAYLPFRC